MVMQVTDVSANAIRPVRGTTSPDGVTGIPLDMAVMRSFVGNGVSVAAGSSSAQSAASPAGCTGFRIDSTVDCWVEVGSNPTAAATTSTLLRASSPEYFAITAGHKVAVLRKDSTDGTAYIRWVV